MPPIVLKHDELSMEPYTGRAFAQYEVVPSDKRHIGAQFGVQAMGTNSHWTMTQETLFSSALTGKPARKEDFEQYCWKRCVIGSREDFTEAIAHLEWEFAELIVSLFH